MTVFFRYPLNWNGINLKFGATTSPYSASNPHNGIDLGWVDYQGEPIFSIGDGVVTEVGTNNPSCGNYCIIDHQNGYISRYLHQKQCPVVSKGQTVKMGQLVGYMGNTGNSNGTHLHLDISYNGTKIDPTKVCYIYPDQNVCGGSKSLVKFYNDLYTCTPVARNENVDQIEVINDILNVRDDNNKVIAYCNLGIYNVLDSKIANGYTWIKIENNRWIARNDEWNTYYRMKVEEPVIIEPETNITEKGQEIDHNEELIEDSPITPDTQETTENAPKESLIDYILTIIKKIIEILKTRV